MASQESTDKLQGSQDTALAVGESCGNFREKRAPKIEPKCHKPYLVHQT